MKITELPEVTTLRDDQVLVVDGGGLPTSKITVGNANFGSSDGGSGNIIVNSDDQWIYHRNTYRGKNLGTVFTDEQKEAIRTGTFDDLFIGDYWTIGNFEWLIADINYWLKTGDTPEHEGCTTPHLVIVPKKYLYTANMNDTNTTTGGYVGSKMYKENLNNAKTIIYTAFGENNILNKKALLTNTVSNGLASAGLWVDSKVDLMNQIMVYGSSVFIGSSSTNSNQYLHTSEKTQLSLFRLNPELITITENYWWLRDILPLNHFANISWTGAATIYPASTVCGVRPAFGLTG